MPGALYDGRLTVVGTAALYLSRTPYAQMAPDTATPLDATPWCGVKATFVAAPTAGTLGITVKTPRGTATTTVAFGSLTTAAAAATAIRAAILALPNTRPAIVDVTVSANVISVYVAGATLILLDTSTLTATTAYTVTPALWITPGSTTEGYSLAHNKSATNLYIEETPSTVQKLLGNQQLTIAATLAEDRIDMLAINLNMDATVVARVAGTQPQKTVLRGRDTLPEFAATLEVVNLNGLGRRFYLPSAKIVGNNTIANRRQAALRATAGFMVEATCPAADIEVHEFEVAA